MPTRIIQNINLSYSHGTSDKVYNIRMEEEAGMYRVVVEYGRRGGNLRTDIKNRWNRWGPVIGIYDKVLSEKLQKGYTQVPSPRPTPRISVEPSSAKAKPKKVKTKTKPVLVEVEKPKKSFIDVDNDL